MRLKPLLPLPLWERLRAAYWQRLWAAEEREEERALGLPPLSPIAGSERAILCEAIADYYPFHSLLEVGCGYGQNFFTIGKQYRRAELVGVDIAEDRIHQGRALLGREGFSQVRLEIADAGALTQFPDRRFDVCVSCGFLLYIPPERIESVLRELLRVTRRGILLLEQQLPGRDDASLWGEPARRPDGSVYWLRNYQALFARLRPEAKVTIMKVPNPRWGIEHWREHGHLIEIALAPAEGKAGSP